MLPTSTSGWCGSHPLFYSMPCRRVSLAPKYRTPLPDDSICALPIQALDLLLRYGRQLLSIIVQQRRALQSAEKVPPYVCACDDLRPLLLHILSRATVSVVGSFLLVVWGCVSVPIALKGLDEVTRLRIEYTKGRERFRGEGGRE